MSELQIIILAAGCGKRMLSSLPKVLHKLAAMPMLAHVLNTANEVSPETSPIVVASEELAAQPQFHILQQKYNFNIVIQKERLGTAHAVMAALPQVATAQNILVLYGDVPLIESSTLLNLVKIHKKEQATLSCLGFDAVCADGYGRLLVNNSYDLNNIIEDKDLSPEQKSITICNSGILLFTQQALSLLKKINNQNQAHEYYLTSLVNIVQQNGLKCIYQLTDEKQVKGVNDKHQLAELEYILQQKLRKQAMIKCGVTMLDPASTFIAADVKFGKDVILYPNVHLGSGVVLGDGATILPFSVIEGAVIGANSIIGPFARLRLGADIAEEVKIGNFVEIKNSKINKGTKINHLAYVGDASIGSGCNIGAGTVFCNYDGVNKNQTIVGDNVFIGSNSSLIAPLNISNNAMVAAGSTINKNINSNELGIARALQSNVKDYVVRHLSTKKAKKHQ
jgi:bifunctional UDP-N-acetylglucosamine pyrophosphorylase/glucosamine-1-phosphate N-acetyltransferase